MGTSGKSRILDAYVQLLLERPNGDILVKEICARAGVHRSTFYDNFKGVNDVAHTIMDLFFEEYAAYCRSVEDMFGIEMGHYGAASGLPVAEESVAQAAGKVAEFLYENRATYLALMRSDMGGEFRERVFDVGTNFLLRLGTSITEAMEPGNSLTKVERQYLIYRITYDAMAVTECWADRSFAETPEEFLRISRLIAGLPPYHL